MRHIFNTTAAIALAALTTLTGCGAFFVYPGSTGTGTSSLGSGTSYVYVANGTTNTIAGFGLATGALVAVSGSPYTLPIAPTSLVITPSNTFLYAGSLGALYGYSIGSGGVLTALNNGSALAAVAAVSMDVSPDGAWLLILDASGVTVDEYQINTSTGILTAATGATYTVAGNGATAPHMIKFAPNEGIVAAAAGTGGDAIFSFNSSTGALAQTLSINGNSLSSDNALTFDSTSSHLYIARSGSGQGAVAYSVSSSSSLTQVTGSPFTTGNGPYALTLDSTGSYLYVSNRSDGTTSGFTVANGALTALSGSPYAAGVYPTAIGRDSLGKYILTANEGGSPDLTMNSIDTATPGKLDSLTSASTGTDPAGALAVTLTH
jgi:6-phosphogluconolactonase